MANFTLQHLLMTSMLTGLLVSILVTAVLSQWQFGRVAPNAACAPSSGTGARIASMLASEGPNSMAVQSAHAAGHGSAQNQEVVHGKLHQMSLDMERLRANAAAALADSRISPAALPLAQPSCPACPACAATPPAAAMSASAGGSIDAAFDAYIALHKRILAREAGAPQRFIVARPQAQLNNRLRVIVGGIALGMLTGRALLVEFSDGYYASLSDCFDVPIDIDIKHFDANRISGRDVLSHEDLDTILCSDYSQRFTGSSIDLGTPPNLIPFFWRNPFAGPVLREIFGEEQHIYRSISLRFLRPSQPVASMQSKFIAAHFSSPPNLFKLGIHLRWGGDMRPQPVRDDEWVDMANCVEAVVPKQHRDAESLAIFVAADTPESRQRAQQTLNAKFPHARVLFYENWLRSNTVGGVQAALTELLLLSQCDALVLTPASSYGEQAQALAGRPGYFVRSTVPDPAHIQYANTHEVAKNCLRPYDTQPTVEHFSRDIQRAKCYHPDMHHISF